MFNFNSTPFQNLFLHCISFVPYTLLFVLFDFQVVCFELHFFLTDIGKVKDTFNNQYLFYAICEQDINMATSRDKLLNVS